MSDVMNDSSVLVKYRLLTTRSSCVQQSWITFEDTDNFNLNTKRGYAMKVNDGQDGTLIAAFGNGSVSDGQNSVHT